MKKILIEIFDSDFGIYVPKLNDEEKQIVFNEIFYRYDENVITTYDDGIEVNDWITHSLLSVLLTQFDIEII